MKKKALLALALSLIVMSLAACGTTPDTQKAKTPSNQPTQAEKAPETPAAPEAPTETDNGDLGAYHVAIKEAVFGKDYEGNPMIVVDYDFTNNSENDATALFAVNIQAFQNGVELETAITMDDSVYNVETAQKQIKPSVTLEKCQSAFVLSDTSPVTIEVSELITLDDKKLVKTFEVK